MSTIEATTESVTTKAPPTWSYSTFVVDGKVCVAISMGHSPGERKYARHERRLRRLITRAARICDRRNAKSRTAEQLLTDVTSDLPSTFKNATRVHGH
jgi:hypothetical protein